MLRPSSPGSWTLISKVSPEIESRDTISSQSTRTGDPRDVRSTIPEWSSERRGWACLNRPNHLRETVPPQIAIAPKSTRPNHISRPSPPEGPRIAANTEKRVRAPPNRKARKSKLLGEWKSTGSGGILSGICSSRQGEVLDDFLRRRQRREMGGVHPEMVGKGELPLRRQLVQLFVPQ